MLKPVQDGDSGLWTGGQIKIACLGIEILVSMYLWKDAERYAHSGPESIKEGGL